MGVIILTSSWSKLGIGNVKRQLEGAAFFRNCDLAKAAISNHVGAVKKLPVEMGLRRSGKVSFPLMVAASVSFESKVCAS